MQTSVFSPIDRLWEANDFNTRISSSGSHFSSLDQYLYFISSCSFTSCSQKWWGGVWPWRSSIWGPSHPFTSITSDCSSEMACSYSGGQWIAHLAWQHHVYWGMLRNGRTSDRYPHGYDPQEGMRAWAAFEGHTHTLFHWRYCLHTCIQYYGQWTLIYSPSCFQPFVGKSLTYSMFEYVHMLQNRRSEIAVIWILPVVHKCELSVSMRQNSNHMNLCLLHVRSSLYVQMFKYI